MGAILCGCITGCDTCEPPDPVKPTGRGPHVQTLSGRHWYPFSPRAEDVSFHDLRALSRICRYGGHTAAGFYSVAEHAVRCAWLVRDWNGTALECLAALHHDSHEAYPPGDQLGPFLRAMRDRDACAAMGLSPAAFAGLLAVEARAKAAVRTALGVADTFSDSRAAALVKRADMAMLATERRDLMAPSDVDWGALHEPSSKLIAPWSPDVAWRRFAATHEELCAAIGRAA